jgi:SAM-dependent methyltransferase
VINPREFWEGKILAWEANRYGPAAADDPWLERLARRLSGSLRARLAITQELLTPHVAGKRVVELGCGSALLAEALVTAGATSYTGYDIAASAIDHARRRIAGTPAASKIRLELADVGSLPRLQADIVFSLGLFDWLSPAEIDSVFAAGGDAHYLHAISEKRPSLSQYLHRLYVYLSYGHRTGSYVPRYHSVREIEIHAAKHNGRPLRVYRDRRLSFGALLTTLPLPQ